MKVSASAIFTQRFRSAFVTAVVFLFSAIPNLLFAQGITIGPGGSINVGGGVMSLGCKDLHLDGELLMGSGVLDEVRHVGIDGTLNGESGTINLAGNWTNLGAVNAGSSSVNLTDGCSTTSATVSGDTTFYDWSAVTSLGKQLNFSAGDTQSVLHAVVFNGAPGNLLSIRSSVPDDPGFLQLAEAGSQDVNYVDVGDNHAPMPGQFMAPGFPEDYNSVDSGGNFRWFGSYTFTITVYKDFNDGNPAEAIVRKECNTGLPLNVSIGVAEGNPITFVTTSIDSGATDCAVTETVPDGYSVAYATGEGGETNPEGCFYTDIEQGAELECFITNSVIPVEVNVRKLWIDEHPEFQYPTLAEADYECTGAGQLDGDLSTGNSVLWFLGVDTFDTFEVIPHWDGQTTCTVTERVTDLSVESDDSDCEQIAVLLGQVTDPGAGEYDCTIYNTRLYEGIPTLDRGNLLLLTMLLISLGLLAIRRYQ